MTDWPHRNSDFVLEKTVEWIDRFGAWPYWLAEPEAVAADLIKMGRKTRGELTDAGYRPRGGRAA